MGKLAIYILVMSGLVLLFYFTGLLQDTGSSTLLTLVLDPEGFRNSDLNLKAIIVLEGLLATGIVIGFAIAGNIELGIMGVFVIYLSNLLWDFIAVFNKVYSVNPVIAILFFSPVLFLFVVTILEWWRGTD